MVSDSESLNRVIACLVFINRILHAGIIGQLSTPPTMNELSNAHARVHTFTATITPSYKRNELEEWYKNSNNVLNEVVNQLGNVEEHRRTTVEHILRPLRRMTEFEKNNPLRPNTVNN